MIRLGPFALESPIGGGGMGQIWKGVHVDQGLPVAVKVLTGDKRRNPRFVQAFENEVQAVAGLHHPGIVLVYDYGVIDEDAESASEGKVSSGSPYLVMELASLGSVDKLHIVRHWRGLREVLLSLLDALAHAHARGVVHRDLKPGNVLLCSTSDPRPGLKISDFGIAHAIGERPAEMRDRLIAGSPHYMAPEQFKGSWRDFGPWTDLYAMGCLAYEFVTGRPPFPADDLRTLELAHREKPPPSLKPLFPVPPGFEHWLGRMLAKRSRSRFQRAADAAWSLLLLGEPDIDGEMPDWMAHLESAVQADTEADLDPPWGNVTLRTTVLSPLLAEVSSFKTTMRRQADAGQIISSEYKGISSADYRAIEEDARRARDSVTGGAVPPGSRRPDSVSGETAGAGERMRRSETRLGRADRGRESVTQMQPADIGTDVHTLEFDNTGRAYDSGAVGPVNRDAAPPMPPTWRRDDPPPQPAQLLGAGLGLYRFRSVPFVDRDGERDTMWAQLARVVDRRAPHMVLLRASAGSGKSRLAEWIAQRAHEVGTCTVIRVTHARIGASQHGIGAALGRFFHCQGLNRRDVADRLRFALLRYGIDEPDDIAGLTDLIRPADTHDRMGRGPEPRQLTRRARWRLIRRVLARIADERPLIFWADDCHWSLATLSFLRDTLIADDPWEAPVLFLASITEESLAERPGVPALINALGRLPGCETVRVEPLGGKDHRQLIRALLGFESGLARRVEERTRGNPLFAVELVGDWVERGLLNVSGRGFQLLSAEHPTVPDDLHEIGWRQLERAIKRTGEWARIPLELAAALGQEVSNLEWHAVCRHIYARADDALVRDLTAHNHVRRTVDGWAFTHSMLRASIERSAMDAGRWVAHNLACAETLEKLYPQGARHLSGRLGAHYVAARQYNKAITLLLEGAQEMRETGEYLAALSLLAQRDATLEEIAAHREDHRWGESRILRAWIHRNLGDLTEAQRIAVTLESRARLYRWDDLVPLALREQGEVARLRGELEEGKALLEQACTLFRVGSAASEGQLADALSSLADMAVTRTEYDDALRHYQEALTYYEQVGDPLGVAHCVHGRGEIARFRGELDEAEVLYRRALAIYESQGSGTSAVPRLNLGLLLTQREAFVEARAVLGDALAQLSELERRGLMGCCHIGLLAACASAQDWEAWDQHLAAGRALAQETGAYYADTALFAEAGANLAAEQGQPERSEAAAAFGGEVWQALGYRDPPEG